MSVKTIPPPTRQFVSPSRHARKCIICNHPDRADIEHDFLRWQSPEDIARAYELPYRSAIYRHAHATGLFATRARTVRCVLENILERWQEAPITAMSIVRAVHAYTRITEEGRWLEPSQNIKVTRVAESAPPPAPDPPPVTKQLPPEEPVEILDPASDQLPDDPAYDSLRSLRQIYSTPGISPAGPQKSNRDIQELESKLNR